jgi:hypothetical protein
VVYPKPIRRVAGLAAVQKRRLRLCLKSNVGRKGEYRTRLNQRIDALMHIESFTEAKAQ